MSLRDRGLKRRRVRLIPNASHGGAVQAAWGQDVVDGAVVPKRAFLKRRIDCVNDAQYMEWIGSQFDELLNSMKCDR